MPTAPEIASLLQVDGPFVSAYLPSPSKEPNAAFHLTTRWKTMRSTLASAGADDDTLVAVDLAVGVDSAAVRPEPAGAADNHPGVEVDAAGDHAGGDVLAIVAAGGRVLLRAHLPVVRGAGRARFGLVPWLTPLLDATEGEVPYVLVVADRAGADLHGYGLDGETDSSVDGSHNQIERNKPGGFAQKRYQQRAIDSWERNAAEVAAKVSELAERLSARLVLIGGDDHAVVPLVNALGHPWSERVEVLEHATRAAGGDLATLDDEVSRLVRTVRAEDEVAVLQRFREENGRHDRAADGPARVIESLQAAMVDTLLVHDDEDDDRSAWFGPEPNHLGLNVADLEAMGVTQPQQARLVDVAVRAALGTGAAVRLVPAATVRDGLGAILRA